MNVYHCDGYFCARPTFRPDVNIAEEFEFELDFYIFGKPYKKVNMVFRGSGEQLVPHIIQPPRGQYNIYVRLIRPGPESVVRDVSGVYYRIMWQDKMVSLHLPCFARVVAGVRDLPQINGIYIIRSSEQAPCHPTNPREYGYKVYVPVDLDVQCFSVKNENLYYVMYKDGLEYTRRELTAQHGTQLVELSIPNICGDYEIKFIYEAEEG